MGYMKQTVTGVNNQLGSCDASAQAGSHAGVSDAWGPLTTSSAPHSAAHDVDGANSADASSSVTVYASTGKTAIVASTTVVGVGMASAHAKKAFYTVYASPMVVWFDIDAIQFAPDESRSVRSELELRVLGLTDEEFRRYADRGDEGADPHPAGQPLYVLTVAPPKGERDLPRVQNDGIALQTQPVNSEDFTHDERGVSLNCTPRPVVLQIEEKWGFRYLLFTAAGISDSRRNPE